MSESKAEKLPQFSSQQELIEFFETHDMGDYEDQMPEAEFAVDIQQGHYLVSVDEHLMNQLLEAARDQQVSVGLLVASWLKEKLVKAS